jgi:UDP-N-acetylglucosamine--N-acetylmuramyl-(pentapeptide) pyrophosphoryl-undecaprenol N-acetylglucosamine transferase
LAAADAARVFAQAAFTPQALTDALLSFLNFPARMASAAAAAAALARPHAARDLADLVMALARRNLAGVS